VRISAIQIAAGLSSRMKGPNKLLQDIGGRSLVEHGFSQLITSDVGEVIVVTGRDAEQMELSITKSRLPSPKFVFNPNFEMGMTTSIQTGLQAIEKADAVMICLSDMPELTSQDYTDLIKEFKIQGSQDKIMVPYNGERRGNPVIFGASFFEQIKEHKEPNGCSSIVKANKDKLLLFETSSSHYFFDIDTPETLKAYKARVKQ